MFWKQREQGGIYTLNDGVGGLGSGLVFASTAGPGGYYADYDLAHEGVSHANSSELIHLWPTTEGPGRGRYDIASVYRFPYRPLQDFGTGPFTVAAYGTWQSDTSPGVIISNGADVSSTTGFRLYHNWNGSASSGAAALYTYNTAATYVGAANALLAFRKYHWLIGVRKPDGTLQLWRDRNLLAEASGTIRNVSKASDITVGWDASGSNSRGYHIHMLAWNRALSPGDIGNLVDNKTSWAGLSRSRIYVSVPSAGGVSGTLEAIEAGDTISASGVVGHTGTLSVTEVGDTFASSGAVGHAGTLSATEAGDVFEASGAVGSAAITGTMVVTEAPDAVEFSGAVGHVGTIVVTEAGDAVAVSGSTGHIGTIAVIEAGDAFVAAGISGDAPPAIPSFGGGIGRGKKDKRIVVVDVDGAEYRVPIRKIDAFLEAVKKEEPPKQKPTIRRPRMAQADIPAPIVIKSAPDDVFASIQQYIDHTNDAIRRNAERKRIEREDDELIFMLLAA